MAAAVLLGALSAGAAEAATSVYEFTGDCTDCSNPHGALTLEDYTPGMELDAKKVVSFVYSSSVFAPADLDFRLKVGLPPHQDPDLRFVIVVEHGDEAG